MKIRSIIISIAAKIRRIIYRLGFRPRPGNILHSPSLSLIYSMREVDLAKAFEQGLESNKGNRLIPRGFNSGGLSCDWENAK